MPRGKDQKTIAKRIDLHYWNKPHRLRTARKTLVLLCFAGALGWMAFAYARKDGGEALYNPGHLTAAHASIEHNCAACHAPDASRGGQFVKAVSDTACLKCHEAPMHAPTQLAREGENADNDLALASWIQQDRMTPPPGAAAGSAAAVAPGGEAAAGEAVASDGDAGGPAPAAAVSQPADGHHGGTLVSAQCAACHVEHRGREALAAVSDLHCTQCHSDLGKAIAGGKQAKVQARVVAFNANDHPAFGRALPKDEQGNWLDETKLLFNHKVHLVDQKLNDCSMCHTTREPNLTRFRPGHDPAMPPFATETDRQATWANASDGRYMQPVSFEQHCQKCHPIKASGVKGELAHEKIEVVRAQVYAAFQQSAAERYAKPPGGEGAAGGARGRRGSKKDEGPADEGEWLRIELEKLNKSIVAVQKSCAKCHAMSDQKVDIASLTPATEPELRAWLDEQSAGLDVTPAVWDGRDSGIQLALQRRPRPRPGGAAAEPPAAADEEKPAATGEATAKEKPDKGKPSAKAKPRKPIKPPALQATVPTGIPNAPRRWFSNSRFDHRSHRDMTCVACHSKLDNLNHLDKIQDEKIKADLTFAATDTKAVLSPGMEWTVHQFSPASDGQLAVTTATKRCADCHQPDRGGQRFASAACVTCHAYHDHSKETAPDGRSKLTFAEILATPPANPTEAGPGAAAPDAIAEPTSAEPTPAESVPTESAPAEPAPSEPATPAEAAPAEAAEPSAAVPAPDSADATPDAADTGAAPVSTEEATPADAPADEAAPAEAEPAPEAKPARRSRRPKTPPG